MTSTDAPDTSASPAATATMEAAHPFDARGVARRFRHAAIFGALDVLAPGETMRFLNDHDPHPLLRQIADRYGDGFEIEYRHRSEQGVVIDFLRRE
ncbi:MULTISPECIES: DUF2249 domain-containing protein [Brevundimonas]|uniref:DUF2249 domain-containing protein n=1 Tax=Brevundimonas albigilva TaxID=1312364 RepID=A0ABY4SJ65_9CAUL|nr:MULTISPECIES: DUF2249 domain-containing protein [Brevundimonas]URI15020.1 DUF2249 domain-containing protein [Brevundimonas albigilva]